MLQKVAIKVVQSNDNENASFLQDKKQLGKWRPIVSLKYLNRYLRYTKFRMTTVRD